MQVFLFFLLNFFLSARKAPNIKLYTSVVNEGHLVLHGVGQSLGVLDVGGAANRSKVAMIWPGTPPTSVRW